MNWGGLGCALEPRQRCCDPKGMSIASPWPLSPESHIEPLLRALSPGCWRHVAAARVGRAKPCSSRSSPRLLWAHAAAEEQTSGFKARKWLRLERLARCPMGRTPRGCRRGKLGQNVVCCASAVTTVCAGDPGPFAQREHPMAQGSTLANPPGAGMGLGGLARCSRGAAALQEGK